MAARSLAADRASRDPVSGTVGGGPATGAERMIDSTSCGAREGGVRGTGDVDVDKLDDDDDDDVCDAGAVGSAMTAVSSAER